MAKNDAPLPGDEMFEDDGLVVDFSSEEAATENLGSEPVPSGSYMTVITKCDIKACGEKSKNPGKPFYAIEFTVVEGPYEKRKVFTNAMLFNPALYTISKLMKAVGLEPKAGKTKIPGASFWLGKELIVDGKVKGDPNGEYGQRYEPNAFFDPKSDKGKELRAKALNAPKSTATSDSKRSTLLP